MLNIFIFILLIIWASKKSYKLCLDISYIINIKLYLDMLYKKYSLQEDFDSKSSLTRYYH